VSKAPVPSLHQNKINTLKKNSSNSLGKKN
jgi:hypothetical protein